MEFTRRGFVTSAAAGLAAAGFGTAAAAQSGRTLLKGGCVLSLDPKVGDFDRADVRIEGGKTGTLTPGKDADIIMLRTDAINVAPMNNAYAAVVQAMDTSNVDTVFIAGQLLKRQGQLVGVDLNRIRQQAQASRDYIVQTAGWPSSRLGRL